MRIGGRCIVQLAFTTAALVTAITSVAFAYVFGDYVDKFFENMRGETRSNNLPCVRSTLDACSNLVTDQCWPYCCPLGYLCQRDPIVGLKCMYSEGCQDDLWCRDFADIPETCGSEVCQRHEMVKRVSSVSYMLASTGIVLDLLDMVVGCVLPDSVIFKSGVNIFSSLMKWLSFGTIIGAGTGPFLEDLEDARCYNADGMDLVMGAQNIFYSYCVSQVLSAILSLLLAPLSAYFGGRLTGVPYVAK